MNKSRFPVRTPFRFRKDYGKIKTTCKLCAETACREVERRDGIGGCPALQLQNLRSCQGFGQSSFQLSRWAFPFLPVCNFDKRMYARILTCVGIMTHVRRTFLPIPSMGDPEHTHPDSESRCSIISIVTFSGGSSSTCRDRSCRIWGSAAVPLIAALTDNHASLSSSIGLS